MSIQFNEVEAQLQLTKPVSVVTLYPVDMSSFLALPKSELDNSGVPRQLSSAVYDPGIITRYALAHWNHFYMTGAEYHRKSFLAQAHWLAEHALNIGKVSIAESPSSMLGWPHFLPHPELQTNGPWLSALTQGCGISVLLRAFQITLEGAFLDVAQQAVATFEHDILDGGVCTPIGEDGVFFEEVAIYPASHSFNGFIFALLGLYDFVSFTSGNTSITMLIERAHRTFHSLLEKYDAGFWTYADLLGKRLTSQADFSIQIMLLEALSRSANCDSCSNIAERWQKYQQQVSSQLRYQVTSRFSNFRYMLWRKAQVALFPRTQTLPRLRVCISIQDFPGLGGVTTVLKGLAEVMEDQWQVEYLTQFLGPGAEQYNIHKFGTRRMTPWYFPFVWLYVLFGASKFISLMRQGAGFQVILPQDGVFSGALAGLAGKITGVRVVCIDHGDLSLFTPRNLLISRAERAAAVTTKNWPWIIQLLAKELLALYWPSRYLLAHLAAFFIDHYLIPGVAGDSVDEGCQLIGIDSSRVTRYGSMIDITRHTLPDPLLRASIRSQKGLKVDAIVVAIVCRLSPEKGLDIALESISHTLSALSAEKRERVRVVIAGDGPIRKQIEETILRLSLSQHCLLLGALPPEEVVTLLGISDIFLYTSTRGACMAMAVLEAMASGCAVIASTEPLSNAVLLSAGRGIAVPAGDRERISQALTQLCNDGELCTQMGKLAREYIALHHSPAMFRRTLLRATYWSELDELLVEEGKSGIKGKGVR